MRQDREPDVRGYAVTHPPGRAVMPPAAGWDQLLYTASGTMAVSAPGGRWVVPPGRLLTIAGGAAVAVDNRVAVAVRSLYLDRSLGAVPPGVRTMDVGAFPRELLLHVVRLCPLDVADPLHAALVAVLADQLRRLPEAPLRLPWPRGGAAVAAAEAIVADPVRDLGAVARAAGAARRSLERAFAAETGLSLGAWRRRARLLASIDRLAAGASVTEAAADAGYATPSAYVAAFRRDLGDTPRRFLAP